MYFRRLLAAFATLIAATAVVSCGDQNSPVSASPDAIALSGDLCEIGDLTCEPDIATDGSGCQGSPSGIQFSQSHGPANKIRLGDKLYITAKVEYSDGCSYAWPTGWSWSVSDGSVLGYTSPTSNGNKNTVATKKLGASELVVTWNGIQGRYQLEVIPGYIRRVEPTPATRQAVNVGAGIQFSATGYDAWDNRISEYLSYEWTTHHSSIATVSETGFVTGRGEGTTNVRATLCDGTWCSYKEVTIDVLPQPTAASISLSAPRTLLDQQDEVQLTATAYDAAGNPIPGKVFIWSVTDPTKMTIDQDGTLTTSSFSGDHTEYVTATADGKSATLQFNLLGCPYCGEETPIEWGSGTIQ